MNAMYIAMYAFGMLQPSFWVFACNQKWDRSPEVCMLHVKFL